MITNSNPIWMYIRRRNVGEDIGTAGQVTIGSDAATGGAQMGAALRAALSRPEVQEFNVSRLKISNVNDFLMLLNSFCATFTHQHNIHGIEPRFHAGPSDGSQTGPLEPGLAPDLVGRTSLLRFGITPSGLLIVTGQPIFWNNFYVVISAMGREMLGIPHAILAPTMDQNTGQVTYYGEQLTAANIIQTANVNITIPVFGQKSLFHQLERRISVSVETDIPISKAVSIQNQKESSNYDLATFIIPRNTTSSINIDGTAVESTADIRCNTYTSQMVLQNRADKITQWSPMLRLGDDLRYCTLRLYLTVRDFDPVNNVYKLSKEPFPFEDGDYWSCDLKFISNV
jgi:hypothetical protein